MSNIDRFGQRPALSPGCAKVRLAMAQARKGNFIGASRCLRGNMPKSNHRPSRNKWASCEVKSNFFRFLPSPLPHREKSIEIRFPSLQVC